MEKKSMGRNIFYLVLIIFALIAMIFFFVYAIVTQLSGHYVKIKFSEAVLALISYSFFVLWFVLNMGYMLIVSIGYPGKGIKPFTLKDRLMQLIISGSIFITLGLFTLLYFINNNVVIPFNIFALAFFFLIIVLWVDRLLVKKRKPIMDWLIPKKKKNKSVAEEKTKESETE